MSSERIIKGGWGWLCEVDGQAGYLLVSLRQRTGVVIGKQSLSIIDRDRIVICEKFFLF